MKRSTDRDLVNRGRFQAALGKVLVFAQFFAMMPVIGVTNPSATQLYFNWKSIRAMYTAIIFVLAAAYLTIVFFLTLSKQITFNSIGKQTSMNWAYEFCIEYSAISDSSIFHNNHIWHIKLYAFGEEMA